MTAKPAKGSARKAARAARRKIERVERAAKRAAKERDGWRCRRCGYTSSVWPVEAAHLVDKQMGGDHGRFSCERRHFVALCPPCHQGPNGIHSGRLRMVYDPEAMGDGVVSFELRNSI